MILRLPRIEKNGMTAQVDVSKTDEPCPVCEGPPGAVRCVVRAGKVACCSDCGSWYRVPRPTEAQLAELYNKGYYDAWGIEQDDEIARITKRATFRPLLQRAEKLITAPPKARILDVGAATGLLLEMAEELGYLPHAVEPNPYAAKVLRERFGEQRVFEGELTDCEFPSESFDVVTMTDVIEHVLDVRGTLQAAQKLLRPGGALVITTPRIDSLSRLAMRGGWLHFKVEHIQYFSRRAILQVLREAGFTDIRVWGHPKRLTFDYLHLQLRTYPHWVLTPLIRVLRCLTPRPLRRKPIPLQCGEMLVLAVRGA